MPIQLPNLTARLHSRFAKGRVENDLSEELQFHLQKEIEKNMAAGMTPEEARYTALRSFGGVDQVKEQCFRGTRWLFPLRPAPKPKSTAMKIEHKEPAITWFIAID